MEKATTAQRLQEIMAERNLRQVDILTLAKPYCDKYGVKLGKNAISQYVSGKVVPGQYKLTVLGLALNVSEGWLMGFDVPRERPTAPTSPEEDGLDAELIQLFRSLSEEKKIEALNYLRYLSERAET